MPDDGRSTESTIKISDLAKAAFEASGGDQVKAARLLQEDVLSEPRKYHALMDPLVKEACNMAVSDYVRERRSKVWNAPAPANDADRVRALAEGNALMFFLLPGGKRLAEATKADVLEAADRYRKQADDMAAKATWLERIAAKLKGNKTVEHFFDEDQLRSLREEIEHA